MSQQTFVFDVSRIESINNDEFHLKNLLCVAYGKGLIAFDDRHMAQLALREVEMELTKKMVAVKHGLS